jgi:deoxyribonuclease IV
MSANPVSAFDELGAHVSSAGGVENAPERARDLDAVVLQLFTKQPNRWAEPRLDGAAVDAFQANRAEHGIRVVAAHDSYLINLASPDRLLWERSLESFRHELRRCEDLGVDYLVTHPGGHMGSGVEANVVADPVGAHGLPPSPGASPSWTAT